MVTTYRRAREQRIDWVVEALRDCAAEGGRHGVTIVYQNHEELLRTAAEVLALLARGRSNKEIAARLGVTDPQLDRPE